MLKLPKINDSQTCFSTYTWKRLCITVCGEECFSEVNILFFKLSFKLIIPFVYISNNISLPGYPSTATPSHPPSSPSPLPLWGCSLPTHRFLPHSSSIPLSWGIKPPQAQGLPLPLMSDKAILCYICICSHGSLPVHSLVGDLVPGSTGWSSQLMLFFWWGCNYPQLL